MVKWAIRKTLDYDSVTRKELHFMLDRAFNDLIEDGDIKEIIPF